MSDRIRRFDTRDIARVAVFAALIAALGIVGPIPVPGLVPITAQTLGVILAGAVLGPVLGTASVGVVLLLTFLGLPLLSGGRGGAGVFVGVSGGYLFGWLAGAFVIGLIVQAGASRIVWWRVAIAGVVGGIGVVYLFGVPVQAVVTGLGIVPTIQTSLLFLPGDLVKVVLATVLTVTLWRAYPPAFPFSRAGAPTAQTEARVG